MMRGFYNLNTRMQKAYLKTVDAIYAMENKVQVPLRDAAEFSEVLERIIYDFPEIDLMWDYEESKIWLNTRGNEVIDMTINIKYHGTRQQLAKKMNDIDQVAERIIEQSLREMKMSDEKCMEAIYKTMISYMKCSILDEKGEYPPHAYTLECLLYGNGVCQGIACAYSYILRKLQIPSMVVVGKADGKGGVGGHAWNIVQMTDGSYRHMDVFWDTVGRGDRFWAIDDIAMGVRKHRWNKLEYPICI